MSDIKYRIPRNGRKTYAFTEMNDVDLWSGMTDMHDDDIYEGDIVLCKYIDGEIRLCKIIFSAESAPAFYQEELDGHDPLTKVAMMSKSREYRVIGNVRNNAGDLEKIEKIMEEPESVNQTEAIIEIVKEMQNIS